jgi:hypothetical protein
MAMTMSAVAALFLTGAAPIRYGRLLATELTDLERQYLHRRIAEEQAELERLARKDDPSTHGGVLARPVAPSANNSRDGSP